MREKGDEGSRIEEALYLRAAAWFDACFLFGRCCWIFLSIPSGPPYFHNTFSAFFPTLRKGLQGRFRRIRPIRPIRPIRRLF